MLGRRTWQKSYRVAKENGEHSNSRSGGGSLLQVIWGHLGEVHSLHHFLGHWVPQPPILDHTTHQRLSLKCILKNGAFVSRQPL